MKKLIQVLICFLFVVSVTNESTAQMPALSWANYAGTTGTVSQGNAIFADNSGNVYTTGGFEGTVDFDPGAGTAYLSSASGSEDIFIQKLDANGNYVWVKRIGGTIDDRGLALVVNPNGTIIITGYFSGTVDFDPGAGVFNMTSVTSTMDIFVLKLSSSGNLVWAKRMGGNYADRGQAILTDPSGNVYTTGHFNSSADFDPGPGTFNLPWIGSYDIFVQKLDSSGNFVWAKNVGSTGFDNAYSMVRDPLGDLYICGRFENTVDFDPGPGILNHTTTGSGIFVLRLNSAGDLVWVKTASNTGSAEAQSLDLDSDGNVYITGRFNGTVDFDPGPGTANATSLGSYDIFILKLNNTGDLVWIRSEGGSDSDVGKSIAVDTSGNVCLTGAFIATVDFDPGPGVYNITNSGCCSTIDVFVQQLDASGNLNWAFNIADPTLNTDDEGNDIFVDPSNNIYTTGVFKGNVDFDPGAGVYNLNTGISGFYIFIQKLNQCSSPAQPSPIVGNTSICAGSSQTYSITNDPGVSSYTWNLPAGWTGTSTTNSINVTTGSSGGTISVVANGACGSSTPQTLNITAYNNSSSSQSISACNNYIWSVNGINYSFSGTYIDTVPNANGCDSVITLNLTINNNTSSSQTTTACTSYTWPVNGNNYSSSGTYIDTIPNANGCDSVITLNLTINNSTSSSQSVSTCNNYTWPVNGNNYTSSGSYNATIPNAIGCDSIITLNLTINNNTSSSINASDCESYISPSGNYTWTTSGSHMDTIPNSNGCDSIITVMLTIHGLPSVSYTETTTPACVYWTPFTLTPATPFGGTYSGPGVTANSFDPTMTGMGNHPVIYQYTDGNNCSNSDTSFIQVNACLSIEEEGNDPIVLFPNPNYGNFTVTVPGTGPCLMKVYDFTGKLVTTGQLFAGDNSISLNAHSGMYFVCIFNLEGVETVIKLVIW